ncbi:hypothetical protein [Fulvimarina sp. MAC8]|uniref:hypothetical protein n=1 Tax=Fulvimarina sp. MAC8 TaxID=3162874 RepID=UPI0032F0028A
MTTDRIVATNLEKIDIDSETGTLTFSFETDDGISEVSIPVWIIGPLGLNLTSISNYLATETELLPEADRGSRQAFPVSTMSVRISKKPPFDVVLDMFVRNVGRSSYTVPPEKFPGLVELFETRLKDLQERMQLWEAEPPTKQ